jgi:hypothetical protein
MRTAYIWVIRWMCCFPPALLSQIPDAESHSSPQLPE